MYFPVLFTEKFGRSDNPPSMSRPSAQMSFPATMNHGSLEDWLIPGLGQEIDNVSLGHLVGSESKDIVKE